MKLDPCPFCGGRAYIDGDELTLDAFVECSQCHAQSPLCRGGPKALEMWNRRAPQPAPFSSPDFAYTPAMDAAASKAAGEWLRENPDPVADDALADMVIKDCGDPAHDQRWCQTCETREQAIDDYRAAMELERKKMDFKPLREAIVRAALGAM